MRRIQVQLGRRAARIGDLICDDAPGRFQASFSYSENWLRDKSRFAIDPQLPLFPSEILHQQVRGSSPLFGAVSDAGPDGWALVVIARNFRLQEGGFDALRLNPLDYLLQVSDRYRVGALRFKDETGSFRGEDFGLTVPPTVRLEDLLNATQAIEQNEETADQIRFLLSEATAVGGLRPKASIVSEAGAVQIAKFPSVRDVRPETRGEALALRLARNAGIETNDFRIIAVLEKPVLLLDRFDRQMDGRRVPYMSGMTILQATNQQAGTYVDLAQMIRRHGSTVRLDLQELFRRMAFNMMISNTDDHLGNHGFLYDTNNRWRLSPAFDVNPFPNSVRAHKTAVSSTTGPGMSIDACLSEASKFGLGQDGARLMIGEIAQVVSKWRDVAISDEIGMTGREADLFAGAFEHRDLREALNLRAGGKSASPAGPDSSEVQ